MSKNDLISKEMYYKAIEESDSGLWVYDIAAGTVFLSDRYYTMLGYEPNEFDGTMENLYGLLHPDDIEPTNKIFAEFFKSKNSKYRNEVRLKNKGGGYTHILTQGYGERNEAGEVVTFIGWNIDITPLKDAQRLLDEERVRSAAQSRLAQLGILAAGLTHEIYNPLMSIQLRSQMITKTIKNNEEFPADKLLEYLETIQSSAKKIESIVRGLRTISDGGKDDQKETFILNKLLEDILSICRTQLDQKQILVQVTANENISFEGNKILLGQVFLNLINNSVDALESTSQRLISINLSQQEDEIIITFADNGEGVPENDREKIFLPFFTTKEPGKGTGLGLSISNSIIQAHKGSIDYSREKDRSIFTIKFHGQARGLL